MRVTCGIPQGSYLGPLLFILYLNDFENCLQYSSASLYADDTHITIFARDIEELIRKTQVELGNISEWMRINKMSSSPKKTEYMIIGHPSRINKITEIAKFKMIGTEIKRAQNVKSLGIIIDEKLNWNDHFKLVKGQVAAGLSSLKKLKNILPLSKLCSVYQALAEIHIRYADVVWGNLPKTKLHTLQCFQDRALSIIKNAKIKDKWQGNWLKVESLIKLDQAVMIFKINNKLCPESLWSRFRQIYEISNYNTRNSRNLEIPMTNLEKTKKGFHHNGLKVWNSIPNEVRELPLLYQFKKSLKTKFL